MRVPHPFCFVEAALDHSVGDKMLAWGRLHQGV